MNLVYAVILKRFISIQFAIPALYFRKCYLKLFRLREDVFLQLYYLGITIS